MKIHEILQTKRILSFEIFPPKGINGSSLKGIFSTIANLAWSHPDFISVTYAPSGRNQNEAIDIADFISMSGMCGMCHLTAVGYQKQDVDTMLIEMEKRNIHNVLALRGDIPKEMIYPKSPWVDFHYAKDLISYIKSKFDISVGAACYPENHPECDSIKKNIDYMKQKQDAGADFFITQLFFDNAKFLSFQDLAVKNGITKKIIPGIMPIYKTDQLKKIIGLSNCSIPKSLQEIISRHEESKIEMTNEGITYAINQINDLLIHGVSGIHLYTMNKPLEAEKIIKGLYSENWRHNESK